MKFKNSIENLFERFTTLIYKNAYKTLFITLCVSMLFLSQLPKIKLDTSVLGMLHKKAKEITDYDEFKETFGQDEMIIVGIETSNVLNMAFLEKLNLLHRDLENNALFIDKITSLINVRNIRGEKDELIVEDLFKTWPVNNEMFEELKKRIIENHTYKNTVISEDATFTALILEPQIIKINKSANENDDSMLSDFDSGVPSMENETLSVLDKTAMVNKIYDITKKHQSSDFKIFIAGSPVLVECLNKSIRSDMKKFLGFTFLVVAVFLLLIFRRVSGMFLPLFVVLISLATTIGIMAATGGVLKMPTSILPSFLLAVGVSGSVHVLALFFNHYKANRDKLKAIEFAIGHSGLAILITSLTTAGGLLSLSTSYIAPVSDLGVYGSIGVMVAFLYTILLLPPLIAIIPLKKAKKNLSENNQPVQSKKSLLDIMFDKLAEFTIKHPVKVLGISLIIIGFAVSAYPRLHLSYNSVKWFPKDDPFRISVEKMNDKLKGSLFQEVIIDFKKDGSYYDPATMEKLDKTVNYLESIKMDELYVGKVVTLTLFLKEINQALNENNTSFYSIPQESELISQEFLLYDNSRPDDIYEYTDPAFSKARLSLKIPYIDAIAQIKLLDKLKLYLHKTFPEAEITTTGLSTIYCSMISKTASSMAKSYVIAFGVISLMMIMLFGSLRFGLVSMIPNVIPVMIMLGLMGFLNIPLDPFTMLVGSIAIGLSVDDTIHFMHQYTKYFNQSQDSEWAIKETFNTTGRAILITTAVLSSGFIIFMFATMSNVRAFGFLISITIILALLADFLIAPSLLTLINRKKVIGIAKIRS